jgi:hypothetical protein
MDTFWLRFTLVSDTTFGRGDGVAGLVDEEVQHDESGLPRLNGRTLKGLLAAECAEILFSLERILRADQHGRWEIAAEGLFGSHGSRDEDMAHMRVGDAQLPKDLREVLADEARVKGINRMDTLESLTAIRRQTAMDPASGAPKENALRSARVVLRNTPFDAQLDFENAATPDELALLAACIKALRHVGSGKTRGRGRMNGALYDNHNTLAITEMHLARFQEAIQI